MAENDSVVLALETALAKAKERSKELPAQPTLQRAKNRKTGQRRHPVQPQPHAPAVASFTI